MKKIILLVIILTSSQIFGQYGRRNRRYQQSRPQQVQSKPVKYSSQQDAGAVLYDMEELFKKSKIKANSDNGKILEKYVGAYNDSIETIQVMYKTTFREIDIVIENRKKEMLSSRNPEIMKTVKKYLDANLEPIKEMVKKLETNLDLALKENLGEKPHEKWAKYKRRHKTKVVQGRRR